MNNVLPTLVAMLVGAPGTVLMAQAAPAGATLPPLQAGAAPPGTLDLRGADATRLIPQDPRDPAQVEAARAAWMAILAPQAKAAALRLVLPETARLPLLLAASQAVRAAMPACRLYLAFQPGPQPAALWDEAAWGALDGGALLPGDLGPAPDLWRSLLARAQTQMPGRPWVLWLDQDPGALAGVLLGDGGRLVVPAEGPAARLGRELPEGPLEIEGGLGDVTFLPRGQGQALRWVYEAGAWHRAPLPGNRNEVAVAAADTYDLGALLAKVRAAQMRNRAALRTLEGRLAVDVHIQHPSGPGQDLGYRYDVYQAAGEGQELVRRETYLQGIRANLDTQVQLPQVEARVTLALPVALAPTERFHYGDGGPAGPGRRRLTFHPVDDDPTLPAGFLVVDEASGQILHEASHRSGLPGTVRSEDLTMDYTEVAPGVFAMATSTAFERWVTSGLGTVQVRRTLAYEDLRPNQEGFAARREEVRGSDAFMLKETVDGVRYFQKKDDGGRVLDTRTTTKSHAAVYGLQLLPGSPTPVFPFAGYLGTDTNLGDRGIHLTYLTAVLVNLVQATIPLGKGWDLSVNHLSLLVPDPNLPVSHGRVVKADQVGDVFGNLDAGLGRDLGAGFRLGLETKFRYDGYTTSAKWNSYATPSYEPPPSGLTREARLHLSWQDHGFQLQTFYGQGQRPDGTYGAPGEAMAVPDQGRFKRWGGSAGYDLALGKGAQLHAEAGALSGDGFDRFKALDLSASGNGTVVGFSPYVFTSDRAEYGKVAFVLPPGPGFRLTLGLDYARIRALDDRKDYAFTGLALNGDLPGFWKFTYERIDLGVGLHSDMTGARTVTGTVMFVRLF